MPVGYIAVLSDTLGSEKKREILPQKTFVLDT